MAPFLQSHSCSINYLEPFDFWSVLLGVGRKTAHEHHDKDLCIGSLILNIGRRNVLGSAVGVRPSRKPMTAQGECCPSRVRVTPIWAIDSLSWPTGIPSDPHSPTALLNHLTAPDVVIWSSVLASAAVPGILPPIPVMVKKANGSLEPSSFGHRWKDGRFVPSHLISSHVATDRTKQSQDGYTAQSAEPPFWCKHAPFGHPISFLTILTVHLKVTFSIVSQTNPHINAFFYASKGTVGRPVTHRKGRGWRGM